MLSLGWLVLIATRRQDVREDLRFLRKTAQLICSGSTVPPGAAVSGGGMNTTGVTLHVPGGNQNFYPAFWIRDAAMMLGDDLVPLREIEGWIQVVAKTQPGPPGLKFRHGLTVPAFSIPDHVTLGGEACWFPGAYTNQGVGNFGYLPPADDAFYFIEMVWEECRLAGRPDCLGNPIETGWGTHPLLEVCRKAFDSVTADPRSELVFCSDAPNESRVDWGFCDSIYKTGACLMPSLLRWQAALRLAGLCDMVGRKAEGRQYRAVAGKIRKNLPVAFAKSINGQETMLISATGFGQKDDVWASAFAVWLGVLPKKIETAVSFHLTTLYLAGGTVLEGQVRHIPPSGRWGGFWERPKSASNTYQNGGYWATPTGWLIVAISKTNPTAAKRLFGDLIDSIRSRRNQGAPFEWTNPATNSFSNSMYGSSAWLVYITLKKWRR